MLLTRFTSRVPVSSQRSTVTTYCAKSMELGQVLAPKTFLSSPVCRYLLNIDLSAGLNVGDDQPESWWRCKWSPVLLSPSVLRLRRRGEDHWDWVTLSPKPHMRARIGCCSTSSLCRGAEHQPQTSGQAIVSQHGQGHGYHSESFMNLEEISELGLTHICEYQPRWTRLLISKHPPRPRWAVVAAE